MTYTKPKHKKLVLSPVGGVTCQYRDLKGYTPQDAIIDWTVGRPFKATHSDDFVNASDVERLVREGYTMLVFTCGGSSETLTMVDIKEERTPYGMAYVTKPTRHARFHFDRAALYCTDEVVESQPYLRRFEPKKTVRDSGF